jgi:hypothetical protein
MQNKFFWIIGSVLMAVIGVSVLYIFRFQTTRGLDLEIDVPAEVLSGVPFEVKVNFSNNSGAILEDARLTLSLPEGAAFFGQDPQKTIDHKSLGIVGVGSLIQETYEIILFAPDASEKEFRVGVNYSTESLGARFEKTETGRTTAASSGVAVEMVMPEKVVSGDEFELEVKYRNLSDTDFSDLELRLEYPPSFTFVSASIKPDRENNIWQLGDLRKGSEGSFTLRGRIIGNEEDVFEMKSHLTMGASGQTYLLYQGAAEIRISSSPLVLAIHLPQGAEYAANPGDVLMYTVSYVNNTDTPLRDVIVRAQLVGEMYDIGSIQTAGSVRLSDNTIIWNQSSVPELASLDPDRAGAVTFSVKLKDAYPIRRFSDKNFTLKVSAEAESPTVPSSVRASKTFSQARRETKVSGKVSIDARAFFRDAASGILNKGVFPPKVGQTTQFTIHWVIKNFATDVNNIEVRAVLGNNVKVVGEAKSNIGSLPAFEQSTNEVVWKLDKIQANQGAIGTPIEGIFQIEIVPTSEMVGNYINLLGPTLLRAKDMFIEKDVVANDVGVTSALPDDTTIGQQNGIVQP